MNNKSVILLFAVLLGLGYAYPTFAEYVQDWNKNYDSEEYARREQIYNAKI